MTLFNSFPFTYYKFGDEASASTFTNLSVYVDILDQVSDNASFYEEYFIDDGDRPDTLSYKLYGDTGYYWTFFLLNEKLRQQGWPLTVQELYAKSREYYPNIVLTTEQIDRMVNSGTTPPTNYFRVNDIVIQGNPANPSAKGKILERILDLGQLVVKPIIGVKGAVITNAGAGYVKAPTVTIQDVGEGSGAVASATVSGGVVTSINISNSGEGYTSVPDIIISPPDAIDYDQLALKILQVAVGAITSGPYYNVLTATVSGYARGDVNNSGSITSADALIIAKYASLLERPTLTADQRNWISRVLRPALLANAASIPDIVPYGAVETTATATADLSSNTFSLSITLNTDDTSEPNTLLWNPTNIRTLTLKSISNQYDAVHHYENTNNEWVDIDPTDRDVSVAGKIPVTYFERLTQINDDLKRIKVLKTNVVNKIAAEYQRLVRSERQ